MSVQNCWQERKNSFPTLHLCEKKRKLNPTTKSSSYRSKIVCWKEALDACSVILSLMPDPVIEEMVDTLNSKFRAKQVPNVILNSKSKVPGSLKNESGISLPN